MWLDIADNWMSNYGLPIVGLFECVAVAYFFNIEEIREFVNQRSEIRLSYWWDAFIKFVTPAVLIYLLGVQFAKDLTTTYEGYDKVMSNSVNVMGWGYLVVLLVVGFALGRNWTPFAWTMAIVLLTLVLSWVTTSITVAGMAALGLVLLFGGLLTCLLIAMRGKAVED
jgi:hypothetical protein